MSTTPPPGPAPGPGAPRPRSGFEDVIDRIEAELRYAVNYVNDAVVPQVRRESITAMRRVSDTLRNLADRFESSGRQPNPPTGPDRGAGQNPSENPSNRDPRA